MVKIWNGGLESVVKIGIQKCHQDLLGHLLTLYAAIVVVVVVATGSKHRRTELRK
jgi:hypothetical protein